tara:strand:- start:45 stop:1031 length:987 start_codon:yes stop_codon:yes gene_type:complete
MKILLIRSEGNLTHLNDFMSDLLLHGLRQLHGFDVIDYPGCWYMYSDEIMNREYDINKIWGKGFTINSTLNNYNSIDRTDIKKKIQNKYFDLVIYGSIRRSELFLDEVIKNNIRVIFIDGEDDNYIDERYLKSGLYFKRELIENKPNVLPVSFAVPKEKIINNINEKPTNLLAPLIPGRLSTYKYDNERTYYNMYSNSIFAMTNKKLGWDCLRHYEILMNGCIPLFLNIKDCPEYTLTSLPKDKLLKIYNNFNKVLKLYFPFKIYKKKFLSIRNIFSYLPNIFKSKNTAEYLKKNSEILEIKKELLRYTRQNLTTETLAKYILDKQNL